MLILPRLRLVLVEVPKTGSQAIRAMLRDEPRDRGFGVARHASIGKFHDRVAPHLSWPCESVAVVRDPVDWLASWHRYRRRDKVAGKPESTQGIPLDDFLQAVIAPEPPAFAALGQQARTVGWRDGAARVDHLFDYARLDLLVAFLSARAGRALDLPRRNASPAADAQGPVSPATVAALRAARPDEFAMAAAVAAAGHLRRPAP